MHVLFDTFFAGLGLSSDEDIGDIEVSSESKLETDIRLFLVGGNSKEICYWYIFCLILGLEI